MVDLNLGWAFPGWTPEERRRVRVACFERTAEGFAEIAHLGAERMQDLEARVEVQGFEHAEAARAASSRGGCVILTAHFGAWELLIATCTRFGLPVTLVHRPNRNPLLDAEIGRWRALAGVELLNRGSAARGALRALRRGGFLAMPLDQDTPREEGVFVPFFGRPACTRDAPARIANRLDVPVLPVFLYRTGPGRHIMRFEPPIELVPDGDDKDAAALENTRRMTAVIEAAIRRAPEQWIWFHRRWKTAPAPGGNPYRAARAERRARDRTAA